MRSHVVKREPRFAQGPVEVKPSVPDIQGVCDRGPCFNEALISVGCIREGPVHAPVAAEKAVCPAAELCYEAAGKGRAGDGS